MFQNRLKQTAGLAALCAGLYGHGLAWAAGGGTRGQPPAATAPGELTQGVNAGQRAAAERMVEAAVVAIKSRDDLRSMRPLTPGLIASEFAWERRKLDA